MKHLYICNNSSKLLIFFNDNVRANNNNYFFSSYKILTKIYKNYDILFIKDIKPCLWYLNILDQVYDLIKKINNQKKYKNMYGLTSSSGTICLLNILHKFKNFSKAVIINGQISLSNNFINSYKNKCNDIVIFNRKNIIIKNENILTPFEKIKSNYNYLSKYVFFYCNSCSDKIYYKYLKKILPLKLQETNLFFSYNTTDHGEYVAKLLNSIIFLNKIKNIYF
jgi:hypothetical protein